MPQAGGATREAPLQVEPHPIRSFAQQRHPPNWVTPIACILLVNMISNRPRRRPPIGNRGELPEWTKGKTEKASGGSFAGAEKRTRTKDDDRSFWLFFLREALQLFATDKLSTNGLELGDLTR
jgi:hypothetical protein